MQEMRNLLWILAIPLFLQGRVSAEGYLLEQDVPYRCGVSSKDPYVRERCVLDLHYPVNAKNYPTVVWFHGGGLKGGNKNVPTALKGKGIAVVAPNYRLHPKVKSPTYIEDAAAAVAWVFKNIGKYGGDPSLVFVSGHSAGG